MYLNARSRPLLTMAGVTAGIASVALVPTTASAEAAPVSPPVATAQPDDETSSLALASECHGAGIFTINPPGSTPLSRVAFPTTVTNGSPDCVMRPGLRGDGVFTLQVAIRSCYPELRDLIGAQGYCVVVV